MTIIAVFLVGGAIGFCIGLIMGCGDASVGRSPSLIGRPPVPRQQKKQGGIH